MQLLFPVPSDPQEQRPSQDRVGKDFRCSALLKDLLSHSGSRVQEIHGKWVKRKISIHSLGSLLGRLAGEYFLRGAEHDSASLKQPPEHVTIAARLLPSSSASFPSLRPRRVSKCSLGASGTRPVPIGSSPFMLLLAVPANVTAVRPCDWLEAIASLAVRRVG